MALKQNGFWVGHLPRADRDGEDPGVALELDGLLRQLTSESMRRAAQMYLDPGRFVRVTLVPEAQAASP